MTPERWDTIQSLFAAASDMSQTDAARYLARACGDDESLRREVSELLQADRVSRADDGAFIADAIHGAAESLIDETGAGALGREAGERAGPYRLLRELGHGGMGSVYLAERADEAYRALVAIKFVRGGIAAPELERRFHTERQILAGLTHPNIARLLDGGSMLDGTPYLVMEYVDGESIDTWCERHQAGLDKRIALMREVCEAVQHAHQSLVIHRDLKPSNILVTADGTPKLVDFGIAKLLADTDDGEATATFRLLTPTYAAPEQIRGGRVTVATDVYALGGVFYKLLTGRTPVDLTGASAAEIERRICETEPPRPSVAAVGALGAWRHRLEGDLDTIVLKALHKDPARRYANVEQLADDLRRHVERLPVLARPDTMRYRGSKFVRRHRVGVTTAAGVLVAVAGLSAFYMTGLARERDRARLEAVKASEVSTFLSDLFRESDPRTARGREVTARELLGRGAERVQRDLAGQPAVQGNLLGVMSRVYDHLGMYDEAVRSAEQALLIRRELHGDVHPEVGESTYDLAQALYDKGDYERSEASFREALRIRQALASGDDADVSRSLEGLGFILARTDKLDEAERTYREALAMERRLGGEEGRLASLLDGLAATLFRKGDYAGAVPLNEESVSLVRKQSAVDTLALGTAINNLAGALTELGRLVEAEALYREALGLYVAFYGEAHPFVSSVRMGLSKVMLERGALEESKEHVMTALRHDSARLGAGHATIATRLGRIGAILTEQGRYAEAKHYHERALNVRRSALGPEHSYTVISMNELAGVYRASGDLAGAESAYREVLALRRKIHPPTHVYLAFTLMGLGGVLLDGGRPAEAEPLLREALTIREAALPAGHWQRAETESALGSAIAKLGRHPEGERLMVSGFEGLVESRGASHPMTLQARQRLAAFYENAGRVADAARYR